MDRLIARIKPHHVFIVLAVLFEIIYNIATPPFQVPDEFNHFYRAYQITEGKFLPNKFNDRLGGDIPAAVDEFLEPFRCTATNLRHTNNFDESAIALRTQNDTSARVFRDFPNTSYYSVISYLPQVTAMSVLSKLGCSLGTIYYGARFFTFLVWLICMYLAIRMMPFYKWLFTFIILLPMNVYITNSFSADVFNNVLSFLFIAYTLKTAFSETSFSYKNLIVLIILISLIAFAKMVYVGLVLLVFLIPKSKFSSVKHYVVTLFLILLTAAVSAKTWSGIVMKYYTPFQKYNEQYRVGSCVSNCADYELQKKFIIEHPTYFPKVIYRSIFDHPHTYLKAYVAKFGNNDLSLPVSTIYITYALIVLLMLFDGNDLIINWRKRFVLFSAAFCTYVLLLLSQHLTWDCVGEGVVDLIQGRYLIPIMPLLFLAFTFRIKQAKKFVGIIVLIGSVAINLYSCKIIKARYYFPAYSAFTEFTCGAECIDKDGMFLTSDRNIKLVALKAQTNEEKHSGNFAVKLYPKAKYSFAYKFSNLNYGDLLEVTAWQKGTGGEMVVSGSGKGCGDFYLPQKEICYRGKDGWNKMRLIFTFIHKCDSSKAEFFIWNPNENIVYFDDVKFSLKKFSTNYMDAVEY